MVVYSLQIKIELSHVLEKYNNHIIMNSNCTCSNIPFSPECSSCTNNIHSYIIKRDNEIMKIKEANIKLHLCKCICIYNICLYMCDKCNDDFRRRHII